MINRRKHRRREQDVNELTRIIQQRDVIARGYPYSGQRNRINSEVIGALKSCINAHGPITLDWISSASKRITGALYGKDFRKSTGVKDEV